MYPTAMSSYAAASTRRITRSNTSACLGAGVLPRHWHHGRHIQSSPVLAADSASHDECASCAPLSYRLFWVQRCASATMCCRRQATASHSFASSAVLPSNLTHMLQATASGLYIAEKIDLLVAYLVAQPLGNLLVKYFPKVRHRSSVETKSSHAAGV